MTMRLNKQILLCSMSALILTACGGGSGNSVAPSPTTVSPPSPPPPPSASSTSGKVTGPISGFGSVIVNGERYDTDNARFLIEGESGEQSDLKIGQIVTLKTETDANGNKTASEVVFEDVVQGRITNISQSNNRFSLLGQTVIIRGSTSFDEDINPASVEGLLLNDYVQVSGHINGAGNIIASQIEKVDDETERFELSGTVSALNTGTQTFKIRGQDIDYSGATFEDFEGVEIANGQKIEVAGTEFAGNTFLALSIELEEPDAEDTVEEGQDGEVMGIITSFTSSQDFVVGETPIITNPETIFEGCRQSELGLDLLVEVEGEFAAEGILIAEEVECEIEANLELKSSLDSVDMDGGTLTIFGVTFTTDMSTRFQDKLETPVENFGLDDLAAGDYIKVKGYEREDMTFYAVKVERDEARDISEVEGFVEMIGADTINILGIEISTTENTEYENAEGEELPASQFFGTVMVDDLVSAEGVRSETDGLLAFEIELENEESE